MRTWTLILIAIAFVIIGVCVDIFLVKTLCETANIEYSWKMLFLYWFMKG